MNIGKKIRISILTFVLIGVLILFTNFPGFLRDLIENPLAVLNYYSQGLLALSAVLGVIFGATGLNGWKKNMTGKADYLIARKYLKSLLKLRDAIKIVRNPFIPIDEIDAVLKEKGYDSNCYNDKDIVNKSVYYNRWKKVQDSLSVLEGVLLDAEASWGQEILDLNKNVSKLVASLYSAIWNFLNVNSILDPKGNDFKLVYSCGDDDDFSRELNLKIEMIRVYLKKYLS